MPGAPRTNPAAPRGAQADLAARLRQWATGLQDRLNSRDTLIELIRSVNATLDLRTESEGAIAVAERVHERIAAHSFLKASDGLDIHPRPRQSSSDLWI